MNDETRKGDWMFTFTGRHFWPLDPRPEDIDIRDIAHHLALLTRFGGACLVPYSVAQHSVLVASIVPDELKLWALLHDAAEAYLGEVIRPLKRQPEMEAYREAERVVMASVCIKFGLPLSMPLEIKHADNVILFTEARDLSRKPEEVRAWYKPVEPLQQRIEAWGWQEAEHEFLQTFEDLTGAHQ